MLILALPSDAPGGLDADLSSHFGHCNCFTIIGIESGDIKTVKILSNPPEKQNGCMTIAERLSLENVRFVIARKKGIGMRPLWCLRFAKIEILCAHSFQNVRTAVNAFLQDQLTPYLYEQACSEAGTGKCLRELKP